MTEDDEPWEAPTTHDRKPPEEGSDVIALDKVRPKYVEDDPITVPVDRARIAVVATGDDAARIRRLCHEASLYVPVMANIAIVHESLAIVVIGEPSPPAPPRVVHVVRPAIGDDALRALLKSLASGRVLQAPPRSGAIDPRVTAAVRKLDAARTAGALEATAVEAIRELAGADRAYCLLHDPSSGALWSEARRESGKDDRTSVAGLAGWAARTGLPAYAPCAGDDPRWLPEIDDPEGKPQTRLAVEPVVYQGHVRAVLLAVRRWRHADFTDVEKAALARLADNVGPIIDRVLSRPPAVPPPVPAKPPPAVPPRASAPRIEPSTTLAGMPQQPRDPAPSLTDRIRAAEAEVVQARLRLDAAERALEELKRASGFVDAEDGDDEPTTEPFEKIDPEEE
ncbi:MAG: GAF domain-containing protein [Acidobacteriota bacterium]